MASPNHYTYNTPIGKVTIESDGAAISRLVPGAVKLDGTCMATPLTNQAANELQEYLGGSRRYFDVPLAPAGTEFQRAVWAEICDIPYGSTRTYAQVAEAVGSPNAFRAVGMAANRNPLPVFVPCHRVVGKGGRLVGYALGLEAKKYLLDLEKRVSS